MKGLTLDGHCEFVLLLQFSKIQDSGPTKHGAKLSKTCHSQIITFWSLAALTDFSYGSNKRSFCSVVLFTQSNPFSVGEVQDEGRRIHQGLGWSAAIFHATKECSTIGKGIDGYLWISKIFGDCIFATSPGGGGEYQWHWQFKAGTTHRKESARARSGHGWRVCWVPLFEDVGILEREKVIIWWS